MTMPPYLWLAAGAAILGLAQFLLAFAAAAGQRDSRALGARDTPLPPLTGVAGRLDRAYRNWLETAPVFLGLVLVGHALQASSSALTLGAGLYLAARLLYVPIYAAGVPVVRFWIWFLSLIGLLLCAAALHPMAEAPASGLIDPVLSRIETLR